MSFTLAKPIAKTAIAEENNKELPYAGTQGSVKMNEMVAQLKKTIDAMDRDTRTAKQQIQQLGKEMHVAEFCPKEAISASIKKILEDKIRQKKVSAKWIEECLPGEYKRPYNKGEQSSLSQQNQGDRSAESPRAHDRAISNTGAEGSQTGVKQRLWVSQEEITRALNECIEFCVVFGNDSRHTSGILTDIDLMKIRPRGPRKRSLRG